MCALGLQSEFCKVLEYLPEEHQFIVRAGVGWRPGIVGQARTGADTESPAGYAFQTGEPVISNHLSAETRFCTPAILVEHGVKRAINVLIQGDAERFGVLEVDSPIEGRFTGADIAFMHGFANLLGIAVERQRIDNVPTWKILNSAVRRRPGFPIWSYGTGERLNVRRPQNRSFASTCGNGA
jgi:GAF domain-containing protein